MPGSRPYEPKWARDCSFRAHDQQDEVSPCPICTAIAISSASLPPTVPCRAIAFCGVHFMAETADVLANRPERLAARRRAHDGRAARPGGRLLDGRHGRHRAGRRLLGGVGEVIDTEDVMPVTYVNSAA